MKTMDLLNLCFNGFSIAICILAIVISFVVRKMNKTSFYFILGFTSANILVLLSIITSILVRGKTDTFSMNVYPLSTFGEFFFSIVLALVFTFYLYEELDVTTRERYHVLIIYGLAFISLIAGVCTKTYYYIDENNVYHREFLHIISSIFGILFMVYSVFLIIRYRKRIKMSEFVVLLAYNGIITLGMIIQTFVYGLSMISVCTTIAFIVLTVDMVKRQVLVYNETIIEAENMKTQIVISQIQPHFLYNSLTAIMGITEDPKKTREAIVDFSKYLRGNMDSLTKDKPIEFEEELKHVETYLRLEKLRFDDEINIVYEIYERGFRIPSLSIQVLAENAIKHGITQKMDGTGNLTIRSERVASGEVVITVIDDGVGFDINEKKNDGRSHVGIENLKKRLKFMCNGELYIESEIGKGTTARIVLPPENKQM